MDKMINTIKKIEDSFTFIDIDGIQKTVTRTGIRMKVRGSKDIEFIDNGSTGDMTESGISINTQEHNDKLYGGCINREEAKELRAFLNRCIEMWDKEQKDEHR